LYFFFTLTAPTPIYTLSLHDALPISPEITDTVLDVDHAMCDGYGWEFGPFEMIDLLGAEWLIDNMQKRRLPISPVFELVKPHNRSEEHTSELQSRFDLVCRLLLEKKK